MTIKRLNITLLVLAVLSLLLIAAQGEPPDLTDLDAVLIWLVTGGSVVAVQYGLSLLVELFPTWHNWPVWIKFLLALVAPVALSFGANALLGYPEVIAGLSPYWTILVQAIMSWVAGQGALMRANHTGYNIKAKSYHITAKAT